MKDRPGVLKKSQNDNSTTDRQEDVTYSHTFQAGGITIESIQKNERKNGTDESDRGNGHKTLSKEDSQEETTKKPWSID